MDKYQASKTLSERAAWDFVARARAASNDHDSERPGEEKEGGEGEVIEQRESIASDFAKRTQADLSSTGGGLGWDLVALCPPFVSHTRHRASQQY